MNLSNVCPFKYPITDADGEDAYAMRLSLKKTALDEKKVIPDSKEGGKLELPDGKK